MKFSYWPGMSNSWSELVDICQHAERTGWDGLWFADHFMPNQADTSGPVAEVFTMLSGVAALVPRMRLGTLVCGNTYRNPCVLAKQAAGVDIISGGRFTLGLGAGWQENEHTAYGIPFYDVGERSRRLAEASRIVSSMFTSDQTTVKGRYYDVAEAPLAPKPVQSPLPILIGGGGEKMTMRIAARYAAQWNVWGKADFLARKMAVLDQHCRDLGRDPKSIHRSAQVMVLLGDDEETKQRAQAMDPRRLITGSIDQVKDEMRQYVAAGVDEFIVPDGTLGRGDRRKKLLDTFINEVAKDFR